MRIPSISAAILLAALAGCSLPGEGPTTSAILDGSAPAADTPPYSMIELDAATMQRLDAMGGDKTAEPRLPPPGAIGRIGAGDVLDVSIWETQTNDRAGSGGSADKPGVKVSVRVEPNGTVTIPFAGRVRAAGLSPSELEVALVRLLRAQTIEPQASVIVSEDLTNAVILAGEIVKPGRVPLGPAAHRVLDVLALGGGVRLPAEKAVARIERKGVALHRPLGRILAHPELDEVLGPGDRVTILPLNRRFYAFGAVNRPGEQEFPAEAQNLIQALGRVAGLQDARADRGGLFLFRAQDPARTAQLLPAGRKAEANVVYHLDLRDPNAFFVAGSFKMQPEDVMFVSNSPVADVSKVLNIITGLGLVSATPRNFGAIP